MRKYLLASVFTLSATATYAGALVDSSNTTVFSPVLLEGLSLADLKSKPEHKEQSQHLDFSKLTPAVSPLGSATPLDLRGYGKALKQVTLPTSASNVIVPNGTKIIFVGDVSKLNLSKVHATSDLKIDLSKVTGMDKAYGADSHNALPSATKYVQFPSNAVNISVPANAQTIIAPAAKSIHITGDYTGLPYSLVHMPDLTAINLNLAFTQGKTVNLSHLPKVTALSLNPAAVPSLVKLTGANAITLQGATNVSRIEFTSKDVTKAVIDAVKTAAPAANIEVLNAAADHGTVLGNQLDLFKRSDITAEKDKVVEAINHMGITHIKNLKLKASHLQYVMDKLNVTDFTGFTSLERLDILDENGDYADAILASTSTYITAADLPSSIKEFYSKNSVVVKGAMSSGALDKKFNATNIDLSAATGLTTLSNGTGFTASTVQKLHLPTDLVLSQADTRTLVGSLSGLTHLYTYGTSDIAALQAGNVPASVTHLDVSNSSATAALPAMENTITHVTVSAAYLAANTNADKFATFTKFDTQNTPANKTLIVTGAAPTTTLRTTDIPNIGTVDLRPVTGATSFSAPLAKGSTNSNLANLYLPSVFDVTASADILSGVSNDVTVYVSGAYSSPSKTLDTSYDNAKLDFSAVTGGALFRVPTGVRSLVLSDGVSGVSGDAAATAGEFDLKSLTQLNALSSLPVAATKFRMNNSSGTAFALDLSAHKNLTELSLNKSKVTSVSLPASASGLTTGGFGASTITGHLNLSGLTGLTIDADHPNPIRGLNAFTNAATSINVITLPRVLPADTYIDLSDVRSTIYMRNLHKADRVKAHATAAQLVKPSTSHGVYDPAQQALWNAYIEEMISSATYGGLAETSLDLSEVVLSSTLATTQSQVNAFFAALNALPALSAAGSKDIVQNIHIRIPDALAAGTLYIGRISETPTAATALNTSLRVGVHKAGGLTVTKAGVGAGQVDAANLVDSSTVPADKTVAIQWESYLMHLLDNNQTVLDTKAVTIGMDSHATALQTALTSLPSRLKDHIHSIVVRLTSGDQAAGSFAANADKLTLSVSSLSALEALFVDLNESQDDGTSIDAVNNTGITLPSSATLIAINKHA